MTESNRLPEIIAAALTTFQTNKAWADRAVVQVDDDQIRVPLHSETNSIAVIMKHVSGNLRSRWTDFLTTDGEKEWRNRDDEFVDSFADRGELLAYWEQGWDCLFGTLNALNAEDLQRTVTIRGEDHSVPLALQRSLGHTCYHVGQIMMMARILCTGEWKVITIPRGDSSNFNARVWGQGNFQSHRDADC